MSAQIEDIKANLKEFPSLKDLRVVPIARKQNNFLLLGEVSGLSFEELDSHLRRLADMFKAVHFHIPSVVRTDGKLLLISESESGGYPLDSK